MLHLAVIKQYDFRNTGKFIFKIVITLAVMSLFVQLVLLIPANSRVTSLIVLVFAGIIGVIVVVTGIIKLKILKNEEMKHLPLMDKIIKE
ncbi:polysaccharide biosynthesis protein [Staphylococcus aureus]|nr:polysaccharide biosynthesis protein [Staphylococcus aureus]